jgi:hypothetical protein
MKWGLGTTDPSTSATETTAPVAATSSGLYSFSTAVSKAKVQVSPTASGKMWLKWNDDTAGKTAAAPWDDILEPGDSVVFPGASGDALVEKVAVWIDAAMTYGTDYTIQGWE